MQHSLPVLLYHRIGAARGGSYPYLSVSFEKFRKQIHCLLDSGYHFLSLSECLAFCLGGLKINGKAILLTFDDAFADLDENALPFLKEKGLNATIFVVTSQVGGTNIWDQERGWTTFFPLLSDDRIRYWGANGIDFGAHSHTHPDLQTRSKSEIEEEVVRSKTELESILKRKIIAFAYPFGSYNESVREIVSKHFELAFTTERGVNHSTADRYQVRRTSPHPSDSKVQMWLRARVGWAPGDTLKNLRNRFHRL